MFRSFHGIYSGGVGGDNYANVCSNWQLSLLKWHLAAPGYFAVITAALVLAWSPVTAGTQLTTAQRLNYNPLEYWLLSRGIEVSQSRWYEEGPPWGFLLRLKVPTSTWSQGKGRLASRIYANQPTACAHHLHNNPVTGAVEYERLDMKTLKASHITEM